MKKIFLVILALLALTLVACDKEEKAPEKSSFTESEISVSAIAKSLSDSDALADTIIYKNGGENPLDEDYFDYYFGNSALLSDVTDYVYYTSATTSVCEAGVFKVKNEETRDALLSAFDTRKENLMATYENYSPADVAIASDMKKGSFDDVVWFVMTKNNDAVKAIIEE